MVAAVKAPLVSHRQTVNDNVEGHSGGGGGGGGGRGARADRARTTGGTTTRGPKAGGGNNGGTTLPPLDMTDPSSKSAHAEADTANEDGTIRRHSAAVAAESDSKGENNGVGSGGRVPLLLKDKLGVEHRTPMGEYVPPQGGLPLSSLALPTPSPQSYTPLLPPNGRQVSILGKHPDPSSDSTNEGPGPSKYNTDPIKVVFEEAPKWSFAGSRGKESHALVKREGEESLPGAATYFPTDRTVGRDAPSFSLSGRFETQFPEDPGPSAYFPKATVGRTTPPKYSFGRKYISIDDSTPGPQSYDVASHKLPPHASTAPAFTFRPKLGGDVFETSEAGGTPSPNAYFPKLPWNERAATLKGWYAESKALKTPGPASFLIKDQSTGPQFSLRGKPHTPGAAGDSPGPATYNPNLNGSMEKRPAYTLGGRPGSQNGGASRPTTAAAGPGPSEYTPRDRQVRSNDGPKVTLKGRWKVFAASTPGPSDYNVPQRFLTPLQLARFEEACRKRKEAKQAGTQPPTTTPQVDQHTTPGPGTYTHIDTNVVKRAAPAFSLGKRLPTELSRLQARQQTPHGTAKAVVEDSGEGEKGRKGSKGPSLKSRMSPFVTIFPSTRMDTLRVRG
ncbi:uncharacterized protein EV422DRAFT_579581 [Fimicolochytrium jonesii]|uniref:uncharacterized protein n=1 Tax=Fimicolochytrium jonesii TaxID=1396493 RepID=UPI0022FEE4CB|nr:uncharacterized protein EV422DRAFT_579581 [Fimicolochytrium jonesii]KAI8819167.1 hypothetical protein EV422DRAFT_579581 [Fimicolochytrium jonesii]